MFFSGIASSLSAESLTFWNPTKKIGVEVLIPGWVLQEKVVSKTENGIKKNGKLYSNIKIFKYDNNPSVWTNFFSIQIEEEIDDDMEVFKDIQFQVYADYCNRDSLRFNILKETAEQLVFTAFCPEYNKNKSNGEIAVFSMVRFKSYFVKTFQQWRGKKMLANDKSTWAADEGELKKSIKSLSSINIKFTKGSN